MCVVPKPTTNSGEGGCHGEPHSVLSAAGSTHGCSSKARGIDGESFPKNEERGERVWIAKWNQVYFYLFLKPLLSICVRHRGRGWNVTEYRSTPHRGHYLVGELNKKIRTYSLVRLTLLDHLFYFFFLCLKSLIIKCFKTYYSSIQRQC